MRLAVLVLALVVACGSKQHHADVDLAHVEQLIATRITEVLARPDVAHAFDAFLDGVLAAPEVDKASDGLGDMLGRDQNLVGTAERMLDMLRQLPALQALIREVTVAHPDANSEQIGLLVAARLDGVLHQPKLRAALDEALAKLATGLAHGLAAALARDLRWTDQRVDRALTADRVAKFAIAVLGNRTARMATAQLVAGELVIPEVQQELHRALGDLASDPALQSEAVSLFDLMLSSQPDAVMIEAKLRKLIMSPRVFGIANHAIQGTIAAPGSAKLGDAALATMAGDPMLGRAYEELASE